MKLDKASLMIENTDDEQTLDIWGQSEECYKCSLWKFASLSPLSKRNLTVNSTYPTNLVIGISHLNTDLKRYNFHFIENGVYSLQFNSSVFPPISVLHRGNNEYIAIFVAFMFFFLLRLSFVAVNKLQKVLEDRRTYSLQRNEDVPPADQSPEHLASTSSNVSSRISSLDTFRGLTIALMIFVNYGGGKYYFFRHSSWNGLTVADLVFPWFLWIMGVSLCVSINSQMRRQVPLRSVVFRIVKRSLILFALGIVINSLHSNYLPKYRIMGVLQRFGFCYLLNALLEVFCWTPVDPETEMNSRFDGFRDLIRSWRQFLAAAFLVALHTAITFLMPVPNCPTGYLGPGGVHQEGKFSLCTGGVTRFVDDSVLGREHMYQHPTSRRVYDSSVPFDPEGLLGVLTSFLTVQLGVLAGRIILDYSGHSQRLKRWIVWALILGICGGILCDWRKEGGPIPVNKNLWSLSFVCVTASFAFVVFSVMYCVNDYKKRKCGVIFSIAGMNSILLYIGHEVTKDIFPWSWTPVPSSHAAHLSMNLWGTCLWLLIAIFLHRRKVYISI